MIDWREYKFLESAANLQAAITRTVGRKPNATVSREIASCVQQGRLFFEAATSAPIEIRPVQYYYGMTAIAKALVASSTCSSVMSLPPSHGLTDVSAPNARLVDLEVRIGSDGTFQRFNNVASKLNQLRYFDDSALPRSIDMPTVESVKLGGVRLALRELVGRIPAVAKAYRRTFSEGPLVYPMQLNHRSDQICELRIDVPAEFTDLASLEGLVEAVRQERTFLRRWALVEAQHAWGNAILIFQNVRLEEPEFQESFLNQTARTFQSQAYHPRNVGEPAFDWWSGLPPLAGGHAIGCSAIAPVDGRDVAEHSLRFAGMFLLSSLVRYRPQIWVHAISRASVPTRGADDSALALIEEFMESSTAFPRLLTQSLGFSEGT